MKSREYHKMIIDGELVEASSKKYIPIEEPSTKTEFAYVPRGDYNDVDKAIISSSEAFKNWANVAPRDRGKILVKIAEEIEKNIEELSKIIAKETGNAIRTQARPEANLVVDIFRYFGGLGGELKGETIPLGENNLCYTKREPLGVVGAIIPWNAPVMLGALKIAPALCAGNTIVIKAAEDAPLGILFVSQLCQKFLPKNVIPAYDGLSFLI